MIINHFIILTQKFSHKMSNKTSAKDLLKNVDCDDLLNQISPDTLEQVAKLTNNKDINKIPIGKIKDIIKSANASKSDFKSLIMTTKRTIKCKIVTISKEHIIMPYSSLKIGLWENEPIRIAYIKNGKKNKIASNFLDIPICGDLIIMSNRDMNQKDIAFLDSIKNTVL